MCAIATDFVPPERERSASVEAEREALSSTPLVQQILDCSPEPTMVLNRCRQVVMVNDKLAKLLGATREALLGRRPGEIFNCIHSDKGKAGCGTSEFCGECGAVQAICESQESTSAQSSECRMTCLTANGEAALDLRVWATPLVCNGEFTVFAVRDISDEKRRSVLERMFFHDVLNAAGGLCGLIDVLHETSGEEHAEMYRMAQSVACELMEEIQAQRDLRAAERGDLAPVMREVSVDELLEKLKGTYSHHMVAAGKSVAISSSPLGEKITSDVRLLSRVLGNLLKNALEASPPGQVVTVSFDKCGSTFSVHNVGAMPRKVQMQLFQRSFSTKEGTGRGVGTYSVKLLTERYLRGAVTFCSSEDEGTTFAIRLAPA